MKKINILSAIILLFSSVLFSCNDDDVVVIENKYPDKIIGEWLHVSSQFRYPDDAEESGLYNVYHDEPIYQLNLRDNGSFEFNRFNGECFTGNAYEYILDDLGYPYIQFNFDCEFEWQEESVNSMVVEVVGIEDFNVLILSYNNNINDCIEFCGSAFQRVE